jgi:hydrogenase/urease accessory protein HupE
VSPLLLRRLLRAMLMALVALTCLLGSASRAHELSMAEMELREVERGEFLWQWAAGEKRQPSTELKPIWPDGCVADQNMLRCGAAGLQGLLAIEGVGKRYSAALIKVFWIDGSSRIYTVSAGQPKVQLFGAADDPRGRGEIARAYLVLGVEHILSGIDHLLFVMGLLFLVGFNRRLLLTITAFTVAHSLTLASSAMGWLVLRPPPVEATIALSIMLVAGEALRSRATLAKRWPALVAFLFGLVHGLGFAGALQEIGLPDNHRWVALLTFNVGVELGQLLTLAVAWGLWRAVRHLPALQPMRTAALYGMGTMAAYWTCTRVAAMWD